MQGSAWKGYSANFGRGGSKKLNALFGNGAECCGIGSQLLRRGVECLNLCGLLLRWAVGRRVTDREGALNGRI